MTSRKSEWAWSLAILLPLVVGMILLTLFPPFWGGYMHGMMGMMGGGWGFMLLTSLAFLLLIALGAYYIITALTRRDGGKTALDLLKERYAKGEITRDEYLKMKEDLR